MKRLDRGLTMRRMVARIADRRLARQKDKKPTSKPMGMPQEDQFVADVEIGSPGIFASSRHWPSDERIALLYPGYSFNPIASEIIRDWPDADTEFDSTIGAPPPVIGNEPNF